MNVYMHVAMVTVIFVIFIIFSIKKSTFNKVYGIPPIDVSTLRSFIISIHNLAADKDNHYYSISSKYVYTHTYAILIYNITTHISIITLKQYTA